MTLLLFCLCLAKLLVGFYEHAWRQRSSLVGIMSSVSDYIAVGKKRLTASPSFRNVTDQSLCWHRLKSQIFWLAESLKWHRHKRAVSKTSCWTLRRLLISLKRVINFTKTFLEPSARCSDGGSFRRHSKTPLEFKFQSFVPGKFSARLLNLTSLQLIIIEEVFWLNIKWMGFGRNFLALITSTAHPLHPRNNKKVNRAPRN